MSERWDEIIDWEKRRQSEDSFFEKLLHNHGVENVLDIACGTGFHSIHLAKAGFNVKAADGSEAMLAKTKENAKLYNVDFEVEKADWLKLTNTISEKYDAVICLGNALTHLFYEDYYRRALEQIYQVLNKGGILVADQRNYDAILETGYSSKHKYYYCGDEVEVKPIIIEDDFVRFAYKFSENEKYYLTLHPIRIDNLSQYILDAGFEKVETYGDFKKDYDKYDSDFIIQVAQK
ncbi:class I SAM-dependent methyltransferase [Natranaerobius thermophilus]|uniref:Methyltransferase type 11 n=1 Tax=Natranaerobius thermophilus (strain ATCC BAA-1301 / DSM 18059 / JW/NM-WN-LF) TaxID=457570 RepID=B2A776_NATTJ|nr:class I SAM-dependent methyltransferase [Natranaerobius thermophilus]ACB84270.1 Methyltransferase type 11 [Natranaerobius thermophilus JW/NM-WN-LF]